MATIESTYDGAPIAAIDAGAFVECNSLSSVTRGESIIGVSLLTRKYMASMIREMILTSNDPIKIFYSNGLITGLWKNRDFSGNSFYNLSVGPLEIIFDELVILSNKLLKLVVYTKGSKITIGNICLRDVRTVRVLKNVEIVSSARVA